MERDDSATRLGAIIQGTLLGVLAALSLLALLTHAAGDTFFRYQGF